MKIVRIMAAAVATAAALVVPSLAHAQAPADFGTPGKAAYCLWIDTSYFECWTPNDGFTVTMSATGKPKKTYARANRHYYDTGAPILRFGRYWSRGGYTCASRSTGLTCRNTRGHGWWLGRYVGYRVF